MTVNTIYDRKGYTQTQLQQGVCYVEKETVKLVTEKTMVYVPYIKSPDTASATLPENKGHKDVEEIYMLNASTFGYMLRCGLTNISQLLFIIKTTQSQ